MALAGAAALEVLDFAPVWGVIDAHAAWHACSAPIALAFWTHDMLAAYGLVLAGVGNGNAPRTVLDALAEAVRQGVPVVRSTRSGSGFIARDVEVDDTARGFVAAGPLGPAKARVMLMTALLETTDATELQARFFDE